MKALNFHERSWERFVDYHDSLLEYSVHPPALRRDQFFSVTQRWLEQGKLLCVDQELVINKEKFQK